MTATGAAPLVKIFEEHLAQPEQTTELPAVVLEQRLRALADAGARAWPTLTLAPEHFVAYLAPRMGRHLSLEQELARVAAADLFVACCCVRGDAHASYSLCREHHRTIAGALATLRDPALAEDLCQQLLVRLFVHTERPPLVAKYGGRGALRHWLKITARREGLAQLKRARREIATDDAMLMRIVEEDNPQLSRFKEIYLTQFKAAFAQALRSLTPRQRNLLRYQVVDGLTLDAIAAVYDVHRATAARWRAATRATLLRETKRAMARLAGTDSAAFVSVMRLIHSELEVSLARLLKGESSDQP